MREMRTHGDDLIIINAKITTMDAQTPQAEAIAIAGNRVALLGTASDVIRAFPNARVIDAGDRRLIPGLNDSHIHLIRGGLNFNLELRWEGIPSLADALTLLRAQAARTPAPQWVRVVGGWTALQFAEKRGPTLAEINAVSAEVPVFVLDLYGAALLNGAALRAVGYSRATPDPPGAFIERDRAGNPTGLLLAKPNAGLLYATLALGPKLSRDDQRNSTRLFMRELNRFGLTSVIDAGGGAQRYPDDYEVFANLHAAGELTVRTAYHLFTQRPGEEHGDFAGWIETTTPGEGDDFYRHNGAGEMLVYSAADFEHFREPRPDLPDVMESQLEPVVERLVTARWPFRLHATYGESIHRFLDVFERVDERISFSGLRWIFDHAETIHEHDIPRVAALGGTIAVQDRMAFQGEHFIERYGSEAARHTPPLRRIIAEGVRLGVGTDATRVASYNPWVSLAWLTTGRSVGGTALYGADNLLTRAEALERYTAGNAHLSGEDDRKGVLRRGMLADLAILSDDYFSVADDRIAGIEAVLTMVDGRIVHASAPFAHLAPAPLAASPSWSPQSIVARQYRSHPLARYSHGGEHDLSCLPL